jgi:hypothetical protein
LGVSASASDARNLKLTPLLVRDFAPLAADPLGRRAPIRYQAAIDFTHKKF